MIAYDSHEWRSVFQMAGSVFPQASKYSLLIAVFAGLLKFADNEGYIPVSNLQVSLNSSLFSGFTFTLSFVLVFRTHQCYNRFWQCATSICTLRAMLYEAASSLAAFAHMSKRPREDVDILIEKFVRLFSLLHACVLACVSDKEKNNDFPVIDLEAFPETYLKELGNYDGRAKVDIVYQWIQILIINSLSSGLLNVPPPILSRVFQETEKSMVEYNQILQVINIPFPFPYAQAAALLLGVYSIFTPMVVCFWTKHVPTAMLFTFICTLGMFVIELIAIEIENPFGTDANDLPIYQFQDEMNSSLLTLINPISRVDIQFKARPGQTYQTLLKTQVAGEFTNLTNVKYAPSQVEEREPKHVELAILPCQPQPQNLGTNKEEPQGSPAASAASPQDNAGAKPNGDTAAKTITEPNWPDRFIEQQRDMHREFLEVMTDLIDRLQFSEVPPGPYNNSATNDLNQPSGKMRASSQRGKCIQGGSLGQHVFQKGVKGPVTESGNLGAPRAVIQSGAKQPSCLHAEEPSMSSM